MNPNPSILIVDDEDDIRRFLATLLRREGYVVSTAGGGPEALQLLEQSPYTLVITDLKMPGMDGLQLLRRIAQHYPMTRGLVVTGYGTIQSAVEATKLGADNYITKPIVIDEFLQTIRNTLQQGTPLQNARPPSSEIPAIAALTHALVQPSSDLEKTIQSSVDLLSRMLRSRVTLRIVDLSSGADVMVARAGWVGRHSTPRSGAETHLLTVALEAVHGHGGVLQVARPPEAAPFAENDRRLLQMTADQLRAALASLLAGRSLALTRRELREHSLQTVHALVRAVEMRDRYTAGHSARVSRYAVALARSMGLDASTVENVRIAALLHDVGKIGISDLLLNKPGPLTSLERARIQEHPAMGCEIIAGVQTLTASIPLVMHHQESYDGLGYPQGLAGEQIPFEARILAVADSFEAITADRAYRKARSVADALDILEAGSGRQWDPILVARWREIVGRVLAHPDSILSSESR